MALTTPALVGAVDAVVCAIAKEVLGQTGGVRAPEHPSSAPGRPQQGFRGSGFGRVDVAVGHPCSEVANLAGDVEQEALRTPELENFSVCRT